MLRNCKCPHLENIVQLSLSELCKLKQGLPCSQCDVIGPNLWICLHKSCLHIGCSEQCNDHSTIHFRQNPTHCVHMNQSSQRIWCYICEVEVFVTKNRRFIDEEDDTIGGPTNSNHEMGASMHDSFESSADDDNNEQQRYNTLGGLVGLQNIANTCYMNAALQALSNTPPLTRYFLECGDIIEANSELAVQSSCQRKAGLAKSYCRLVKDMWSKYRRGNGYVVPSSILYGIRNVHPMFRGFQQHDTQEFLRCFMDQLHEELKEATPPTPEIYLPNKNINSTGNLMNYNDKHSYSSLQNNLQLETPTDEDRSQCSTPTMSQSEAEYETCDSGVSEQSSLSDEIPSSSRKTSRPINIPPTVTCSAPLQQSTVSSTYSRSPSPTSSQRTMKTASLKSNRSNSVSSINSLSNQQQQQQKQIHPEVNTKLPSRSIISDVFDGKLLSSVQCLTCDRVSTREETFQDLSLPIPGKDHLNVLHQSQGILAPSPSNGGINIINCTDAVYQVNQDSWFWWLWSWVRSFFWGPAVSLHDCMSAFFSADELKGDNMYSCEKCNKLRNGIKFSRVLALPEMLCVHLKRFRHDLSYSSKISSPVHFPLVGLDMRPYLHKECTSEVSTYDLTAVICHHGTVGGGHYTSFAKHEITGKWFEFDDQLVSEASAEAVQNCEAYVLFYRKTNPQMAVIRNEAMQLDVNLPEHASDIRFFISRQWLNKFNTFAEPGPIDNWALLCPHGGLSPSKVPIASRLAVALPQPLWEFLYKRFGGGPVCNHLYECDICRQAAEALARRQNYELDAFSAYKDETTSTIYAISMDWFRRWQLFVGAVTDEEPGPINNKAIAQQVDALLSRGVRPGSDYAQINSTLWKFFYNIYGGGPEIILRGNPPEEIRATIPSPTNIKEREERPPDSKDENTLNIISPMITSNGEHSSQYNNSHLPYQKDESDKSFIPTNGPTAMPNAQSPLENGTALSTLGHRKAGKNVSFEDDDHNGSDRDITSGGTPSVTSNEPITTAIKRGKHHYSSVGPTPNDIVSKKDKRHRAGIKSNGLFGAEGKYSDMKAINSNDISKIQSNYASSSNGNATNGVMNSTACETNKKLDEITPLLHLSTISNGLSITNTSSTTVATDNSFSPYSNSMPQVILENNNVNGKFTMPDYYIRKSSASSYHHHTINKTVHRKRFKTKSGRKLTSYNLTEANFSDSDKN